MESNIVHEKQRLQLCAIHTINNLLQLNADLSVNADVARAPATKEELDLLADNLTCIEKQVLSPPNGGNGDGGRQVVRSPCTLSIYDKIFSNHRTPILGNYSFEVRIILLWQQSSKVSERVRFCVCIVNERIMI